MILADLHAQRLRVSIAQNPQLNRRSRSISLTATCNALPFSIFCPFSESITSPFFNPALLAGESGVTCASNRARRSLQIEEARIRRSHVVQAHAKIAMVHNARS